MVYYTDSVNFHIAVYSIDFLSGPVLWLVWEWFYFSLLSDLLGWFFKIVLCQSQNKSNFNEFFHS